MSYGTKLWLVVLFFFFSATYMQHYVLGVPQVPCFFIFGDSLSDCGNNNKLDTDAKVNYFPYGIDFPDGPTGRFTNGRTSVDIITQLLGFDKFIPPYAYTDGSDILLGVNYASGAAGIRNETGTFLGEDINMDLQLQNHKDIVSQIAKKVGSVDKAQKHLHRCLYYVNIGSNDYINNYFEPEFYPTSRMYTPEQYAVALSQQYSTQLKTLYALGARKFVLVGLGPVGCIPYEISLRGKNGSGCVNDENRAILLFNDRLKALVDRYNRMFFDAKFIFINSAQITIDTNQLPDIRCCEVGLTGLCIPGKEPCPDRDLYPFFDAFHPSDKVNQLTARNAYNAPNPSYAYPMDISHLIKL